jgi:hypothetical protein
MASAINSCPFCCLFQWPGFNLLFACEMAQKSVVRITTLRLVTLEDRSIKTVLSAHRSLILSTVLETDQNLFIVHNARRAGTRLSIKISEFLPPPTNKRRCRLVNHNVIVLWGPAVLLSFQMSDILEVFVIFLRIFTKFHLNPLKYVTSSLLCPWEFVIYCSPHIRLYFESHI